MSQKEQPRNLLSPAASRIPISCLTIGVIASCNSLDFRSVIRQNENKKKWGLGHTQELLLPIDDLDKTKLLWTLLCTALIGNVITDAFAGNPPSINYAICVCVLSWVTFLVGMRYALTENIQISAPIIVLDLITALLSLTAGILLAAKLEVHSCENTRYILNNSLTRGSHNPVKRCRELQTATAFMWFLFISLSGSLVMDLLKATKNPSKDQTEASEDATSSQT